MGLLNLFRRKHVLKVVLSRELLQLYRDTAAREGLEVEIWARRHLNRAVPTSEIRRLEEGARRAVGIEAAFQALDQIEAENSSIPMNVGHPCSNLRDLLPVGYRRGECQGTCASPDRKYAGKICHWSVSTASQCPAFVPKALVASRR